MKELSGLMLLILLLGGCTTIGITDQADLNRGYLGEPEIFRICIYRDITVPEQRVEEIIGAIDGELALHGLKVEVPWIRDWDRPAFQMEGILKDIAARPLDPPCDRLFAIVGRDYRDFVWGIVMPEVLGAVEDATLTKGYAVGAWGSLNQVLSLKSPEDTAVHEVYHLLGCGHGLFANACYKQVTGMRRIAQQNRREGQDFFPAMSLNGRIFWTRAEVDSVLRAALERDKESFSHIGFDEGADGRVLSHDPSRR
jgi:hypothetical protein